MGNDVFTRREGNDANHILSSADFTENLVFNEEHKNTKLGELLCITTYPPRECGIATYSQNLIQAINTRFENFGEIKVCALEHDNSRYYYPEEVALTLNTTDPGDFARVAGEINRDPDLLAVILQHEFDLFGPDNRYLTDFIHQIEKPVTLVFHTVKSRPPDNLRANIQQLTHAAHRIIVMASVSKQILVDDYHIDAQKIEIIPYGTPYITPVRASELKEKHRLMGRTVISTIGLLSPGKGIETTLEALPAVVKAHPEIIFLVVGKTHPEYLKKEGEQYRIMLESKVKSLKLQNHVHFLNVFFTPDILAEYFQLSDICIFSCKDTDRPMSATLALSASCGNAVISTPTQHARELLGNDAGLLFENMNSEDLSEKIIHLLDNPALRKAYSENILKKSHAASWTNSAYAHGILLSNTMGKKEIPGYNYFPIRLDFLKSITDRAGMLHTTYKGEPDLRSGYTLDDNALALFVFCMHYKITGDSSDIPFIRKYLKFIYHCLQPSGIFYKYLDYERKFTPQNTRENLEETQAKAILGLGYLFSMKGLLPAELTDVAGLMLENTIPMAKDFQKGKSVAIAMKGLYYYYSVNESAEVLELNRFLARKLVDMYQNTSGNDWKWFEPRFTNWASTLPEALLNTWLITGDQLFKNIALESYEFLASRSFRNNSVDFINHKEWINTEAVPGNTGEKPCDIAFNVIALSKFYLMCKDNEYFYRMDSAFKWFLGNNRLQQMVYNPATGSCFDGLDGNSVSLSQSAESALCFVLARMVVEKYKFKGENHINQMV